MCDECKSGTPSAPGASAAVEPTGTAVAAKVPAGFDATISVRLIAGREGVLRPEHRGCQPRKGAERRDTVAVALPDDLTTKLRGADKAVIAWLARDAANARRFLMSPVDALVEAGVELTRADQKALLRAHGAVRDVAAVPPGVDVSALSVAASARARVGSGKSSTKTAGNDADCGC